MPRFALRLDYDGEPFNGWQRQADQPSVQGAVEAALARLGETATVQGAGRTDTGVHATGQVAHADLARDWDPFRLSEALNFHLKPLPVAVTACVRVSDDFHARFSAVERRYLYRILNRRAPPVLDRGQVWPVQVPLDPGALAVAGQRLVGRRDFTTFRAALCQAKSPVKSLDEVAVEVIAAPGGQEIRIRFRARSFLHNQVRSMVGSLERVAAGAWTADDLTAALEARDRSRCGPVAPPQGLCLTGVGYPDDPF